jgi:calcium/calmodulin-dependent protein kinase I
LLASKDEKAPVKLADFGLSTVVTNDDMLKTSCGTLTYAAPEILRGEKYGKSVDMWSIGVITYILLSGYPPFWAPDDNESLQLTLKAAYDCNL